MKKLFKYILLLIVALSSSVVLLSSLVFVYEKREKIKGFVTGRLNRFGLDHEDHGKRFLVNPLVMSKRQIPPKDLEDLIISEDAIINGQWSAPVDWNVTAIHAALLPNEKVLTFGSFGVIKQENKDIRANKKITISDGRNIERDKGMVQWRYHDVNSGVDFDIWDIKKGFGKEAHKFYNQPIVMDSFCSVVRVIDNENVLIIGGNKNEATNIPDTQTATSIYNIKNGTFKRFKDLKFPRWYGSIVRTADEKLIILGGVWRDNHTTDKVSTTPEMIDLKNINAGWSVLEKADNKNLFGNDTANEWNYPRSYLSSDGNIVGISYNKIWVMDKENDYRASQTSEIPLAEGGIARHLEHKNPNKLNNKNHASHHGNHNDDIEKLRIVSMGAPVGSTSATVMIGKDQVFVFGGKQDGDEYTSSNQIYNIDFSESKNPKLNKMKSMTYPRSNANATILPNGEVFINGGEAYNDHEFSIFTPEIYNVRTQTTRLLSPSYFRRNYHSTSLLLPDGRILVSGGDVWNSEIFYPPYLFEKDWNNKTILAQRPKIINLGNELQRGEFFLEIDENKFDDIEMITLLSAGSTTHAQASEPKFRSLEFKKINNKFLVDIPLNKNELANGIYMLFAVRSNGVPSVGKIINLN